MPNSEPTLPQELQPLRASSRYLATLLKNEGLVQWLVEERSLWRKFPLPELYRNLSTACASCSNFEELARCLRRFKQAHFTRLAGRDMLHLAPFSEVVAQVSDLARVSLQVGLHALTSRPELWMSSSQTTAGSIGNLASLFGVLGLGKLGGQELNFVSDVDLIFLQDPKRLSTGDTDPAQISRLAQALTRLLSDSVAGDRVFIVDMRLRPGGKDGVLVPSVDRAVSHYQIHGQAWERQALLKARPVAGQKSICNAFLEQVRPFVFRRFLDFQALDEIRAMRDKMLAEARKTAHDPFDLKLGQGGIREVEFVVQSLQLIYGGRFAQLDQPNTLACLQHLQSLDLMSADAVQALSQAYILLRRMEHWVQLEQNRQTHTVSQADMQRLAMVLGYPSGPDVLQALNEARRTVHEHFIALFRPSSSQAAPPGPEDQGSEDTGFDADFVPCPPFEPRVRRAVGRVMAKLHGTDNTHREGAWLFRLSELFHKLRLRPGLVVLLNEEPEWLPELVACAATCQFVASLLLQQPSLIEGLPQKKGHGPGLDWNVDANRIVHSVHGYEQGVEWVRRLKNERTLHLVLEDIQARLGQDELEQELSSLADWVAATTWSWIEQEYLGGRKQPVAVLALGKWGSREMGYLSDLDLMFVFDPPPGTESENIPVQVVKLIQRFMRMLSTPLQEGPGYAVDAQIRPSGNYGPLIVTKARWVEYYRREADIWEVQALLRMRAVAGEASLGLDLERIARDICFQSRDTASVWPRLCHLRGRIEQERSREAKETIDLKLGPGGLADMEFLVQGCQLTLGSSRRDLQAACIRDLVTPAGRELDLAPDKVEAVLGWYQALRALEHRLHLFTNQATAAIRPEDFQGLKRAGLWPIRAGQAKIESWNDIHVARREIRRMWSRMCAS